MAKLIHPLLCCGLAVLCLGWGWDWGNGGQNLIRCNAKRSLSLLLQWTPCSFQVVKTGFNPAPDDFTPARNCQDPNESIKKNTTETKERELWGKSSLGTGLLTHQARDREKFTPIENSIQSFWGVGKRGLSFLPTMETAHSGWVSLPPPLPNFRTLGLLQRLSSTSLPLLSMPPLNCPKQAVWQEDNLTKSFHFHYISISESRRSELISRVYCIIHATRTCTEKTGCCCTLSNHRCTTRKGYKA